MPRFAANLSFLWTELDFMERFAAAARAGFKGIEYMFPYEYPKEQLAEALARHRLVQVLHNLPAGDWAGGERGIACLPDRVGEFQEGVGRAIEYATALDCKQMNCLAGLAPQGIAPGKVHETLVSNLRFAAAECGKAGIRLLTEPINNRDMPGFCLNHTGQTLDVIRETGSDNLYLQYDIYHMQIMEGDLAHTIETHLKMIAAHAARRQPRPPRAGHRRDQLPVPVRPSTASATPAGSAANTSPRRPPRRAWAGSSLAASLNRNSSGRPHGA
jgi:hydroxypyruvate isomerase